MLLVEGSREANVLQFNEYVETCSLLDPFQTGYKAGHSTQTTFLKLTEDARAAMERKNVILLLLFDFSKAFDTVCHVTMLRKLKILGLAKSALKLIASYLSGREQAVLESEFRPSSFMPFNIGVPQGSVLGLLLFALYIYDVSHNFSFLVLYLVYVDDPQVYVTFPLHRLQEFSNIMSEHATHISNWQHVIAYALTLPKQKP